MSGRLWSACSRSLDSLRLRLAWPDAVLPLSLLGLLTGVLAAATIIGLRLLVEWAQRRLYPGIAPEDFESLAPHWQFLAPLAGGVLIGILFRYLPADSQRVGITHILERLAYHHGRLPWRNAVVQFLGGSLSMISGHSVGREGPSAHLGAASSNLPAQALNLPHNSLRILAACGAAAGIAASFNTSLAGAAFAMEVLLMEYTVAAFAPILLATVSATALTRIVFGDSLAFEVPPLTLGSLTELPWILLGGILIGLLAAAFIELFQRVARQGSRLPVVLRLTLAGAIVGGAGFVVPEILGNGDDTVNRMLLGEPTLGLLAAILVMKIIATVGGIGLGLPGGIIGPSLFIGAAAGALLGGLGNLLGITTPASIGLYAMIGMGAMMAGTLQAPLTGLIAILELTGNPNFILPGMLAVVAATVTSGQIGRPESIFQRLLKSLGLDYRNDPVTQSLRRVGVTSVMHPQLAVLPRHARAEQVDAALAGQPQWVLIEDADTPAMLLAASDLVRARQAQPDAESYDLLTVAGERYPAAAIDLQANLLEALQQMNETGLDYLYVVSQTVPGVQRVRGMLGREDVESAYRY